MKCAISEYDGDFSLDLTAETLEEAATITRIGINKTTKFSCSSSVSEKGNFNLWISIGKKQNATSLIKSGK